MLGGMIQASASLLRALSQTGGPVYPFPLFMAAHAARISIAFRTRVRSNSTGGRLTWSADLAGFLIMAWGGAFVISLTLGHVPPQLLSSGPWLAYSSIHILTSLILYLLPIRIHAPTLDLALFWLDAATKSGSIFGALAACAQHHNPHVQSSPFIPIILSALAPVGGGTVAHMLNVHQQDWSLTSPPWLKPGNGLISTLEMWTGALSAVLYGLLTQSHPAYEPWREAVGLPQKNAFTALGAKATVVTFLILAYGVKALYVFSTSNTALARPTAPRAVKSGAAKNGSSSASPLEKNGHSGEKVRSS